MALPKWATTVTPLSKTLALIIFIAFPIVGFLLGMKYETIYDSKPTFQIQPTIVSPSIVQSNAIGEKSDWKTYISANDDFTIAYPYKYSEISDSDKLNIDIIGKIDNESVFPVKGSVSARTIQNPGDLSLQDLGNQTFALDSPQPYDLGWINVKFANQDAIEASYIPPGDAGKETIYLMKYKNNTYAVIKRIVDDNYDTIADKILSTFSFIDQIEQTDDSNFKTYLNQQYNFSFKYPRDWNLEIIPGGTSDRLKSPEFQLDENNRLEEIAKAGAILTVTIGTNTEVNSLEDLRENMIMEGNDVSTPRKIFNIKRFTVNNQEALEYDYQSTITPQLMGTDAEILQKEYQIYLKIIYSSNSFKNTFDQIISTLNFRNK